MKLTLVMACSAIGAFIVPLILFGITKLVSLSIQHVVESLLNGAANHLAEMILELMLINFDNVTQVLSRFCRCSFLHNLVISLEQWLIIALFTIDQRKDFFNQLLKVRKILYVIVHRRLICGFTAVFCEYIGRNNKHNRLENVFNKSDKKT